ncbi:carboxypeptidase-like regulatory domain-containing protein [Ferruginibacter albus]|uniref:carboxypeptidase-like regulatory domain-containing protein n=1 Tax=Ferruginibacter albus TaxID=2875540 RepID=UPI001CC702B1|nr:carboxypeptidase-like regulatory domain-containing protein [Ferruginibacter albus]UAY51896.1 carboxypeptidase-like regulatory domain-containing protein [Ferruginibacter albus]
MKKLFLAFVTLIIASVAFSQSTYFYVKGVVIDAQTKAPLQAASVFAENTTQGTVTDAQGNFALQLPSGGYDIAITFTGYSTETRRISSSDASNKQLEISLNKKEESLAAVAVVGSNEVKDGWEKYGELFTNDYIGKTRFSSDCHILNPDVLKFYYSKRKNRLKVLSSTPIEIRNDALGYNIKYTLDSFTYDYNTQTTVYTGSPLFEEMKPETDAQLTKWKANRIQAYHGSILQFMRSVYKKTMPNEGFEIQFIAPNDGNDTAIKLKDFYGALNYKLDDSDKTVEIKPNQQNVAVIYNNEPPEQNYLSANEDAPKKYQLSFVAFSEPITIESNGYYYDQNDLTITGYWAWTKVADMLPYDFVPE